jgi:hypothetical protein
MWPIAVVVGGLAEAAERAAIFELDGLRIRTLDDFYDEISRVLIPGSGWGRNLDAFNDILRVASALPRTALSSGGNITSDLRRCLDLKQLVAEKEPRP